MTNALETRLPQVRYMAYPFRMTEGGSATSTRMNHIREQIMQVLFTSPGERVFRPEFGFGARQYVFESNAAPIWEEAQIRLYGALTEALAGEIDPKTLVVEVSAPEDHPEQLLVKISYTLVALQKEERHEFPVSSRRRHG